MSLQKSIDIYGAMWARVFRNQASFPCCWTMAYPLAHTLLPSSSCWEALHSRRNYRWGKKLCHRLKWPPGQAQGLTFLGQKEKRMQVRNVSVPVHLQVTFNTNKSSVYILKSPGVDSCQALLDPGTQIMLLELGLTPPLRFVFLWSTSSGGLFSRHGDPWKLQVLQEKTDSQSFSKSHWAHAGALSSQVWETVQRGGSLASSEPHGLRVEDQSFRKVKLRFFC